MTYRTAANQTAGKGTTPAFSCCAPSCSFCANSASDLFSEMDIACAVSIFVVSLCVLLLAGLVGVLVSLLVVVGMISILVILALVLRQPIETLKVMKPKS